MKAIIESYESEVQDTYTRFDKEGLVEKLFNKDAYLWTKDKSVAEKIKNRLGWLQLPDISEEKIKTYTQFADEIRSEQYTHVVVLGMGGSSLCTKVAIDIFPKQHGYPQLLMLDNTAPEAILAIENTIALHSTLFIVASKSGTTLEPNCFFKYFYTKVRHSLGENAGRNFIAITDAGTPLVKTAEEHRFRQVFISPTDVGGRYSVLTEFGLLPMALMGINISLLLGTARTMMIQCSNKEINNNPGFQLGINLAIAQKRGMDKVTLVASPTLEPFGYWVEQLLAESTGKEGKGLIPVTGEQLGGPGVYQGDRVFIYFYLGIEDTLTCHEKLSALEALGNPVIRIKLDDAMALGAEFYRWEIATAVAGIIMEINPFDEPNVAESKENTNNLLAKWKDTKNFPAMPRQNSLESFLEDLSSSSTPGKYISLLVYCNDTEQRIQKLDVIRNKLRDGLGMSTTVGFGPRYLHSTGQLYKGGPTTGAFVFLAGDSASDVAIPDEEYSFCILNRAQSLGDFNALETKGRKVVYIDIGKNIDAGLDKILKTVNELGGRYFK